MSWLDAAAWGAMGGIVMGAGEIIVHILRTRTVSRRILDWPGEIIANFSRVVIGATLAVVVNQETLPLSPVAAILVGTAGPAVVGTIGRITYELTEGEGRDRRRRIEDEARRLAKLRPSLESESAIPREISVNFAGLLIARQEALAGQLPVVEPREEGRASA